MKKIIKYFLNGLLAVAPITLTIWILVWLFQVTDGILGQYLEKYFGTIIPVNYIPGIGLLVMLALITLIGFLASAWVSRTLVQWVEIIMSKIPLVKSIYGIIKDTIHSFLGEKKSFSQVVLVKVPGTNMKIVGFVTVEEVINFKELGQEHLAVYIPQSFQVAGFTVLVPKEDVILVEMSADEALKFVLSAGVASGKVEDRAAN
ncbi:MAG: DUF502 domain-containing protein [Clostridia bacterium]|nr:DUF502 domain-containing protein [Clostridia bacterium]